MKRIFLTLMLSVVLIGAPGCVKNPAVAPVPGSSTTDGGFDGNTYLALATIDGIIKTTKDELTTNRFSAATAPAVKAALNDVILGYNAADTVYLQYHAAALANTASTVLQAMQAQVQVSMSAVSVKLSILTTAKAGQ